MLHFPNNAGILFLSCFSYSSPDQLLSISAIASGAHLLISCPAPEIMCNSACGRSSLSRLEAFKFTLSFSPQRIFTGQLISFNLAEKSKERME